MREFAADLHIHSALSPCAADEMRPGAIVAEAIRKGLDIIAVCDHNSSGNAEAVRQAAGDRLLVVPGIEITTAEEVHVVGLFAEASAAEQVGAAIRATLPPLRESSTKHWTQDLVDARGRVIGHEAKMLSAASSFSLGQAVALIHGESGLAVAAHVDRPSFSVLSQLGIFPIEIPFDAVEISPRGMEESRRAAFALLDLPILASSDSHSLLDIGACRTLFNMESACFEELALALKRVGGRRCNLA